MFHSNNPHIYILEENGSMQSFYGANNPSPLKKLSPASRGLKRKCVITSTYPGLNRNIRETTSALSLRGTTVLLTEGPLVRYNCCEIDNLGRPCCHYSVAFRIKKQRNAEKISIHLHANPDRRLVNPLLAWLPLGECAGRR